MAILSQFILRLSFGMALGMMLASPRQVTSGYYRNHLYVLLGLSVLATLVALADREQFLLWPPLVAAIVSYVGSACWLYEKPRAGMTALAIVSAASLWGALADTDWSRATDPATATLTALEPITSGLLLGLTMAAMFLGHWYLNSPTMAIAPLMKLVVLMGAAVMLRAAVEGAGLAVFPHPGGWSTQQGLFVSLRWLSGIVGVLLLVVMTYRTLEIPNTQSATGILYVGVIATFLGELTALLLAAQAAGTV